MSTTADAISEQPARRQRAPRFWEIDALRGVAIIMMVIYHLMWNLWFFQALPNVVLYAGFWKYFQRIDASLFILLVGVSLTVSYRRALQRQGNDKGLFVKFALRGLRIFALGLVITLGVALAGTGYVHFGILHFIGFSIIAAYPFLRLRWVNLLLWAVFFVAGSYIATIHVDFPWLVWIGLTPERYYPVDFFPAIPWFGVVLLGIFIGNTVYDDNGRIFPLPDVGSFLPFRGLQFLGRHSLIIYLVHQPLLFAILAAVGIIQF